MQELKANVAKDKVVLLVCPVVPLEGIYNFAFGLRAMLEFKNVRYVNGYLVVTFFFVLMQLL